MDKDGKKQRTCILTAWHFGLNSCSEAISIEASVVKSAYELIGRARLHNPIKTNFKRNTTLRNFDEVLLLFNIVLKVLRRMFLLVNLIGSC